MFSLLSLLLFGVALSVKPIELLKKEWKHHKFPTFDHFWNETFGGDEYRPMTVVMKEIEEHRIVCKLEGRCPTYRQAIINERVNCVNGFAGEYPCSNVDLLAFIPLYDPIPSNPQLGSSSNADGNDIWGYRPNDTSPYAGRQFAITGQTDGASIVEVTNPLTPVVMAWIQSQRTQNTIWRDMKVKNEYVYIVADGSGHGVQWINIDRVIQAYDAQDIKSRITIPRTGLGAYDGGCTWDTSSASSNVHNIALNEESGFAYTVGGNQASGGLYQYRVGAGAPEFSRQFPNDGYTHDTECVTYRGPDTRYTGEEICFGYNENSLTIVNMSPELSSAVQISRTTYPQTAYTHQGWLTEDQAYLLLNDELDEQRYTTITRTATRVWDVRSLTSPVYMGIFDGRTPAIDHNLYIRGNYAYLSNYRAGLSVVDVTNIAEGPSGLSEVAYFDTFPSSDSAVFDGAWSNYPYFEFNEYEGTVVVQQDINRGFFVLLVNGVSNDKKETK